MNHQDDYNDDGLDPEGPGQEDMDNCADESVDLEPCPACGKPVYTEAQQCPYCGLWITRGQRSARRWWIPVAVILLIASLLYWTFVR